MIRPDLSALVTYWQNALRLRDWRVQVEYVKDLTDPAGQPVYGLCSRFVDNKQATILIRDPQASKPLAARSPSIEEVIIHELLHLHFAPLAGNSSAEIAAEEQAVWSISGAIVGAKGTGREAQMMRAMLATIPARRAAETGRKMNDDDKAALQQAIKLLQSLVDDGGDDTGGDPVPPANGASMSRAARLPPEARAALDARMGLGGNAQVHRQGNALVFPILSPEEARVRYAKLGGER